jgi:hypothetical protein
MEVASDERDYRTDRRRWSYVWLLLSATVLAVSSAVIWPNNALQLWSFAQLLVSSSAEQTVSRISSAPELLIEFGALKDEISELRNVQQKINSEITALQSAQQELQRSSVKAMSWYSEPNALLHQEAASKPKATVRNKEPSTQPRPPTRQEANAETRRRPVPLPLVQSPPTAPETLPIR